MPISEIKEDYVRFILFKKIFKKKKKNGPPFPFHIYWNLQKNPTFLWMLMKSSKKIPGEDNEEKEENGLPFPSISIGIFKSTSHSYES